MDPKRLLLSYAKDYAIRNNAIWQLKQAQSTQVLSSSWEDHMICRSIALILKWLIG